MFSFIKEKIKAVYSKVVSGIASFLSQKRSWDTQTRTQLEKMLLESEFGSRMTHDIIAHLEKEYSQNPKDEYDIRAHVRTYLETIVKNVPEYQDTEGIYFLCGVNGSGKTTTAIKLALLYKQKGKTLLVAADTFRAAAVDQLKAHAEKNNVDIFVGNEGDNPATVVYKACQYAQENQYTRIIIDTAGRLQHREALMQELSKMSRVAEKASPQLAQKHILVVDATLGQNVLDQALLFNQAVKLSGLIVTKFDALTKPGIIFAIMQTLHIPVIGITHGETVDAYMQFSPELFIERVLYE